MSHPSLDSRLQGLRSAFDDAFARPVGLAEAGERDFLRVRMGSDRFLIGSDDLVAVRRDPRILRLPTVVSAFLGVVRERGQLLPVYSLDPSQMGAAAPGWLVVLRAQPIALAFDDYEGHLRLLDSSLLPAPTAAPARAHLTRGAADVDGTPIAILDLDAVLTGLLAWTQKMESR